MKALQESDEVATSTDWVTLGLSLLAFMYAAQATWVVVAPDSFAETLVPFGAADRHLLFDYGAASATAAVSLALAARIRSWRVPLVVTSAVWSALHAASHLVAAVEHSGAIAVSEAVAAVGSTVLLLAVLVTSVDRSTR